MGLVILSPSATLRVNSAKMLVLYRDVTLFLRDGGGVRKVVFGCCGTRFFATLRMTRPTSGCRCPSIHL